MVSTCNIFFSIKTLGTGSRTSIVASHSFPTLQSIKRQILVTATQSVYCAVGTEFLYITQLNFIFQIHR